MYDRQEVSEATENYWGSIRSELISEGIDAPAGLDRDGVGVQYWTGADLVLSHTCGMPYRNHLHSKVKLVGTPDFGVPGCPSGYYYSVVVVRRNDTRHHIEEFLPSTIAINGKDSQSGYAAIAQHLQPSGSWFSQTIESGSHRESARCVVDGQADIASIDATTWQHLLRYDAFTQNLRVLGKTMPTPALPYICALAFDADVVFHAVKRAIDKLTPSDRQTLSIRGLVKIPASEYLQVPNPPT